MINTYTGETCIKYNNAAYVFRPSFYALSKISEIENPIELFKRISAVNMIRDTPQLIGVYDISACVTVMHSCYTGDDTQSLLDLTGCTVDSKRIHGNIVFKVGKIPVHDLIVLSYHLIKSALIGKPKLKNEQGEQDSVTFDASEFVGCAVANLGLSVSEAWNMTMIEFQRAIESRVKVNEPEKPKPVSQEKVNSIHAKVMARYKKEV